MSIETEQTLWQPITTAQPPVGVIVRTRIDDGHGVRNDQRLQRIGRLWFVPDGSIYVYYVPTHFIPPAAPQLGVNTAQR